MPLKTRIIPCLDIKDGMVVKGVGFENLRQIGNPVEYAEYYNQEGADELCLLDITASSDNRSALYNVIEMVAKKCTIPFSVGGGIRTVDDIKKMIHSGADKVSIGTGAISNINIIEDGARLFGSQCIIISIDAKLVSNGRYEVYTHGGRRATGIDVYEFALRVQNAGAGEILVNAILSDGSKQGFDNNLNKRLSSQISIPLIASGGAGKPSDFIDAVTIGGADAVLAASIFHNKEYTISQVKNTMLQSGLNVRIS
jgi:cyclase